MFRRFAVALLCALVLPVSAAQAWTWPVDGPVLRPFSFDRAHPYAAGQHRGVDLGAQSGTDVHAPASGVVTFAGTVPTGGKTVSIQTPFGHTATLVHLGSINVTRGAPVTEGAVVGTVGPSGVVDLAEPFVYFGVRVTSDDQGYVDPLPFMPARPAITAPPESKVSVETPAAPASGEAASTTGAQPVAPPQPAKDTTTAPPVETIAAEPAAVGTQVATPVADAPAAVAPAAPKVSRRTQRRSDVVARGTSAPGASIEQSATSDESRAEPSTLETVPLVAPVVARELRHAHSIAPSVTATASQRSHARGDSGGSTAAGGAGGVGWLVAFAAIVVVVCSAPLVVRVGRRKAARIMSSVESEPSFVRATAKAQDLGGARLAVCVGEATPGPRGRVRGTGGHLRALPPPEGQRRLDGERHGRARDTRDGRGRSRGRLAA